MNEQLQSPKGAPLFNPWQPDFIANPYPHYHQLREADPMHLTPLGFRVASRHPDVTAILRDKRFGKDFIGRLTRRSGPQILEEPVYRSMSHWMLQLDPPDHGRLRSLVVRAFTARRVEDMRPRIQQIVDEIIDRVEPQGHMDLIANSHERRANSQRHPAFRRRTRDDGEPDRQWTSCALPQPRPSFSSLKSDLSQTGTAIEELLRYDSSVQVTGRTTLEYVDEIGGISLEKGQSVICLLGSANRDPEVYVDPGRLDITRRDVRPLSFGGGIHYCVGAQLARIEAEIAIATLLRRLPNLQLHDVEQPDWRQTFVLRGLNKLPATW